MAFELAARIRAKLLKRRHSSNAPSFVSSHSAASSLDSQSANQSQASNSQRLRGRSSRSTTATTVGSQTCAQQQAEAESDSNSDVDELSGNMPVPGPGDNAKSLRAHGETENEKAVRLLLVGDVANGEDTASLNQQGQAGAKGDPPAGSDRQSAASPPPKPCQSQPPHPSSTPLLSPPSASRLHSIDEGSITRSPTTAPAADDDDEGSSREQNNQHSDALAPRECRPAPLELVNLSNHHHHNHPDASAPATHHTPNVNTPASFSSFSQVPLRKQSLISPRHSSLIKTLLHGPPTNDADETGSILPPVHLDAEMVTTRKIWVKRSHASPTLVTINEDDLVDDVRDMILRKYANSLGRTFDSPDLSLRICPRDQSQKERLLGPEEHMGRTLDSNFPGGQSVDEALVIDIPRRTPKPSPRPAALYVTDDGRPSETGEGYFPPVTGVPSSHHQVAAPTQTNGAGPHSISVLGTGHIPPIPSPGGTRSRTYRDRPDRPRPVRTHTTSPNVVANSTQGTAAAADTASHGMQHYGHRPSHSRAHSNSSDQKAISQPANPTLANSTGVQNPQGHVATPPPRVSSPRPSANRIKKSKKTAEYPSLSQSPNIPSNGVPPISVLIVEDNPINLKLLEAFVKRLKVRWQTAMNGRDAVKKWRNGGFHLVLMDIQLPGMNGLDATREIRKLERVNSIGVFSSSPSSLPEEDSNGELKDQDRLENISLFKSPVIIVALTASSLQSDRHEALAAGCNDFLTKPVNFVWLERKVMEWGCMQALIDFDGWRKWKDFSQEAEENEGTNKTASSKTPKSKKTKPTLPADT